MDNCPPSWQARLAISTLFFSSFGFILDFCFGKNEKSKLIFGFSNKAKEL